MTMGPAKKAKAAPPALVADDPKEMKQAISRMLGFLKYRADPTKNKKGTEQGEAQQVLEASRMATKTLGIPQSLKPQAV